MIVNTSATIPADNAVFTHIPESRLFSGIADT